MNNKRVKVLHLNKIDYQFVPELMEVPKKYVEGENGEKPKIGEVMWMEKENSEWDEFDANSRPVDMSKMSEDELKLFREKVEEANEQLREQQKEMNRNLINEYIKIFEKEKNKNTKTKDWLVGKILKCRNDIDGFKGFLIDFDGDEYYAYKKGTRSDIRNVAMDDFYVFTCDKENYYYCGLMFVDEYNEGLELGKLLTMNKIKLKEPLEDKDKILVKAKSLGLTPIEDSYIMPFSVYKIPKKVLMKFVDFEGKYFKDKKLELSKQNKIIDCIKKVWKNQENHFFIFELEERDLIYDNFEIKTNIFEKN